MTRALGLLAALLIFAAGCGAHHDARKQSAPTTTAPARACSDADERTHAIRFRTSDGVTLAGAVAGSGPVGAVLVHEYPLDHCGWWPYARYLSRHGVRVLLFDLRCFGRSACPGGRGHAVTDVAAAMAELRRRGARRVALVGASMGGAISVVAAARLHPAAVVDLSGESDTTGLTPGIAADAAAAAPGVTAPALFAVARGDRYVTPADMRTLARRARSPAKRVIVLPATAGHGWDMLLGTTSELSPLAATVAAFIRRHAAPPTPPLEKCPGAGWQRLPTSGIYSPAAARLGRGRVGVVFANDSDNVTCAWSAEARSLAEHGYAVAVFETAGNWAYESRQVLALLGAATICAVAPAVASAGVCESGEFCLYRWGDESGGRFHSRGADDNLNDNHFVGSSTGVIVADHTLSVKNRGVRVPSGRDAVLVSTAIGVTRNGGCVPRGTHGALRRPWQNRIESYKWVTWSVCRQYPSAVL